MFLNLPNGASSFGGCVFITVIYVRSTQVILKQSMSHIYNYSATL